MASDIAESAALLCGWVTWLIGDSDSVNKKIFAGGFKIWLQVRRDCGKVSNLQL